MKSIDLIKKIALAVFFTFAFTFSTLFAQNDTMYVMKNGIIIGKYNVNTQVDSVIFYKPTIDTNLNIAFVNIAGGSFNMGSPTTELGRFADETQYPVTLSAFKMSKYEITNTQFSIFLNAVGVGSDGIYAGGEFPTQKLITASNDTQDWGLIFTRGQWLPVEGYENHPVVNVTWYGATEFATFAGAALPTEAQWEYACRAGTTTPFHTGECLNYVEANYDWANPYNECTNAVTTRQVITQAVGTYPANAWGLHDMHGNVWEWCSDWFDTYPTTATTNPTGPTTGLHRVYRGGSLNYSAQNSRSALRYSYFPHNYYSDIGFRVVIVP